MPAYSPSLVTLLPANRSGMKQSSDQQPLALKFSEPVAGCYARMGERRAVAA